MATRIALAASLVVLASSLSRADDKPLDRAEIDKRAAKVAYEAAVAGTEIYNGGNQAECMRLYQGTLQALLPMLDHRPKLTALIGDKMSSAKLMRPAEAATAMREALDAVMGHAKAAATLWDRLGGEKVVREIVHDAGMAAGADPKVNVTRGGRFKLDEKSIARMEQLLVEFVSASSGGPLKYSGKDLATAHKGMKITDAEFDDLMGHVTETLKKHKIGQKEIDELLAAVEATRKLIVEVPKK
jgi:hemoglobin